MDKSEVKIFSLILGGAGAFLPQKPKLLEITWNGSIWSQKIFPHRGGGLFCHKNQSHSKLPEMDKSEVKKFSLILEGELFCHKNQSWSKLPEMDKSEVKKFSLILGGGRFSAHKNQSCSKLPEMDKSEVKKILPLSWGEVFCHKNQSH